ncbi:glycolate oxidase subunit GlcF [Advenella sp. WQ 585]|uniref:Glycolate oxidase iron-sulfur subunit n=1 Tax=Advenella mandrilli TaxID=2800330 RepID=A0ABS1EBU9_9BURK|nr:glycolate oxidase subunit GlcF [Advenella mandrilli]MBK1781059.1 glycolate oxidase subunit GlcF [Advenella mandrilli]
MQTNLAQWAKDSPDGKVIDEILRKCVHCGFCQATCPSYQILGDELDSPRGRIYLIKEMVEGQAPTTITQTHLDQCLTCRNCETTCPSGVEYGKLLDIGRELVDEKVKRSFSGRLKRKVLAKGLNSALFGLSVRAGRRFRSVLPERLAGKLPLARAPGRLPDSVHARKVLLPLGCVQPDLMPSIDAASIRVLDAVGISAYNFPVRACCGAVNFHLDETQSALQQMRHNLDTWVPLLETGKIEAIVMNASGCGAFVKEYPFHFRHDPVYLEKAHYLLEHVKDIAEVLAPHAAELGKKLQNKLPDPVAFHPPCTLQHWQGLRPLTEKLLAELGFNLTVFGEANLCCGAAGTYSLLQPEIALPLRDRKLAAIDSGGQVKAIITSNMGCMSHLQSGTPKPVRHWIEVVDDGLST